MVATILFGLFSMFVVGMANPAFATPVVNGDPKCGSNGCSLEITISGEIDPSTATSVQKLVALVHSRADQQKGEVSHIQVLLNSRGGSVTSAISIGRILRKEEARAIVPDGSICNSACVLILGGAVTRSFER